MIDGGEKNYKRKKMVLRRTTREGMMIVRRTT